MQQDMVYNGARIPEPISIGGYSFSFYGANPEIRGAFIYDGNGNNRQEVYAQGLRFYAIPMGCKGQGLDCGLYGMEWDDSDEETAFYLKMKMRNDANDILGLMSNTAFSFGLVRSSLLLSRAIIGMESGRFFTGSSTEEAAGAVFVGILTQRYFWSKGIPDEVTGRLANAASIIYSNRCENGLKDGC